MILSCPDCSTRFAIDADKLGPDGRRVKCGKCAHVWFESAPEPADVEEDDPVLRVTPLDPDEQSRIPVRNLPALHQAKKARSAKTGWIVSVVLLVAVLAVLWWGREPIARTFPQMQAVYDAVNIAAIPADPCPQSQKLSAPAHVTPVHYSLLSPSWWPVPGRRPAAPSPAHRGPWSRRPATDRLRRGDSTWD